MLAENIVTMALMHYSRMVTCTAKPLITPYTAVEKKAKLTFFHFHCHLAHILFLTLKF